MRMNCKNIILLIIGIIELSTQLLIIIHRYFEQKNKNLERLSDSLLTFCLLCVIAIFTGYLVDFFNQLNLSTDHFFSSYALSFHLLFLCLSFLIQDNVLAFKERGFDAR